jgi:hypothetical protein
MLLEAGLCEMQNENVTAVKIKSIRLKGVEDVYNLEVDKTHCFSVNGGYIVHNCRYASEWIWSQTHGGISDFSTEDLGF